LADEIFGHSNGKVGAGYGRDLSPDEVNQQAPNSRQRQLEPGP
jgi:hypothetical protein